MLENRVFFVGLRYQHHAQHSGYEGYGRYVGIALPPPVNFRWTLGKWGWKLNRGIARVTGHPWYSLGANFVEAAALLHMVRHRKCLYHVLYGDTDLWLLRRANLLTGNCLVATFHQPTSQLRNLGIVERVVKYLDAVIVVSAAQRSYFEEFVGPERVFVVPHGVDTEFFRPGKRRSKQPICVTVGSHLRDYETLKQAMRRVWDVNPSVQFVGIGTNSSKVPDLRGFGDERLTLLERVSDEKLLETLQKAKVAFFSFVEATANNALLEAMACGLPIVATDVGGIGEYVNEKVGILCPQHDPHAIASGILRLLDDESWQTQMAKASRARALQYDFRIVADQMIDIYSKIIMSSFHCDAFGGEKSLPQCSGEYTT